MMTSKRALRFGVCGAVLGTVYLGLAASAMAWTEPLWVRQFGPSGPEQSRGVATDAARNVYLTGVTRGPLGGPYRGNDDAWVAKYNAAGRALWKRQLGTAENDAASGVATDAAGTVYLTGATLGSLGGHYQGNFDAWMAKYNAAGHALWKRQFGTKTVEASLRVATDAAGNVYLSGMTSGSLGGANNGLFDAWVAKYDAAGRKLWTRQLGTESYDFANGVATDAAGNLYLAGETDGSLGGANHGGFDAWLAKYSTQP